MTAACKPEKHASHPWQRAMRGVDIGQHAEQHDRGQDEAEPRDEAAAHAVQFPAEEYRELQCLGTRQQHAEIERIDERRARAPSRALDDLAMQDCDLPGGTAERNETESRPEPRGFSERGLHAARRPRAAGLRTFPTRRGPRGSRARGATR